MRNVIVVGGGAAGAALANRLTMDADTTVVVMEAGPDTRPEAISVPSQWPLLWGSDLDYLYESVPQAGASGKVKIVARGRALGGSTIMNALIHQRPRTKDLKHWGPGWSAADLTSTFATLEGYVGVTGGGPAKIMKGRPEGANALCRAFIDASAQAGFECFADFNAPDTIGAGWYDLAIDENGERADAANSYLRPIADRSNLEIRADTTVERLLFDGRTVHALDVAHGGERQQLPVSGELVLSAGAIDTAVLLLRSGVGPAEHLRECGIELVLDLPVGLGLQDHPCVPVVWATSPLEPPQAQWVESVLLMEDDARIGGRSAQVPFLHFAPLLPEEMEPPEHSGTALACLVDPRSAGSLALNPEDPDGRPRIDPAFLSDSSDVDALVALVELCRGLGRQEALTAFDAVEVVPGPEVADNLALERFVRDNVVSFNHASATCRLGDVVDQRLRIRGAENLSIADASIMPGIPRVATSALSQAIGWRAAELLLRERT